MSLFVARVTWPLARAELDSMDECEWVTHPLREQRQYGSAHPLRARSAAREEARPLP